MKNFREILLESDRDETDIKKLVKDLKKHGREYGDDDDLDSLGVGGERFSYKTRSIYTEIGFILADRPDLVKYVTPDLHKYFDSRRFNKQTIEKLYKANK